MQFIPAIHTYNQDIPAKMVWEILSNYLGDDDGVAYYQHPNLGSGNGVLPDFVILARSIGAVIIKVVRHELKDIDSIDEEFWSINKKETYSPLLELEDFEVDLSHRFNRKRKIRNKIPVKLILALPSINSAEMRNKFPDLEKTNKYCIWQDSQSNNLPKKDLEVDDLEWRLTKSVIQSASELNKDVSKPMETVTSLGDAMRILERNIALLDEQQSKVSVQIPPGPQMIRGLAGTGKTVLLTMKAANIHSHYPDKRILFTFNTQSLYNQAKDLISRFYRSNRTSDPDWTMLHIRHGWGGAKRDGVYSDICKRHDIKRLTYPLAKSKDYSNPFRACCNQVREEDLSEYYDYVLVDEAQDFPSEFFKILWRISKPPHCIYYAFDELQSLSSSEIPSSERLFGVDEKGKPLVDLEGEYPGPMDKVLMLYKSYRCHHKVLMLAHAIGLGIYNPTGCVQMIYDRSTWESIGYEIESGDLQNGTKITIKRPEENSPNIIDNIYKGDQDIIITHLAETREKEINWVAERIEDDVKKQQVPPERIIVISLNSMKAKTYMGELQSQLAARGVASVVPGLMHGSDEFAEEGCVTLSTVYRAKGNEAPIVYILSFDYLYDYVLEIGMRNRAFTSISRSKAWLRISGVGENMKKALREIEKILGDIPYFKFEVPDKESILRNLDAAGETTRRKTELKQTKKSVKVLSEVDLAALASVDRSDLEVLMKKIKKAQEEKGVD